MNLDKDGITLDETLEEIKRLRAVNKDLSNRNEDLRGFLKLLFTDSEDLNRVVSSILGLYQDGEDITQNLFLTLHFEKVKLDYTNQRIKTELDL